MRRHRPSRLPPLLPRWPQRPPADSSTKGHAMKAKLRSQKKKHKHYTLDEANRMLPLLRVILRDVTTLAKDLRERYERIVRLQQAKGLDRAHEEEVEHLLAEFERGQEK